MNSYVFNANNLKVEIDLSSQILRVEAEQDPHGYENAFAFEDDFDFDPSDSMSSFLLGDSTPRPFRSLVDAVQSETTVPLMVFAHKAKCFNDWLYSTLDFAAFVGDCPAVGKQDFVRCLRDQLDGLENNLNVQSLLYAAEHLGSGESITHLPGKLRLLTKKHLKVFEQNPILSLPLGFYSRSEALQQLFRHDRLLQRPLEPQEAEALASAITQAQLSYSYDWHLRASSRLTGKHAMLSVTDPLIDEITECALFPPSKAPETELVKKLFGGRPLPKDCSLLDTLLTFVQEQKISLKPDADDGWYIRELYALEALLKPEKERLLIGERYSKSLEQLFKGLMSLSRESHIKQLELPTAVGAPFEGLCINIHPRLRLEPIPDYYQRMANNYMWMLEQLRDLWGESFLHQSLSNSQEPSMSVGDALLEMHTLFLGAYYLCLEDLGLSLPEPLDTEIQFAMMIARKFISTWRQDPDISTDSRMMVPLYYDHERKMTRISVVCGYLNRNVDVEFAHKPNIHVTNFQGQEVQPKIIWNRSSFKTVYPMQFECDVVKLLDRESFRAIADQYPNPDDLRVALENLS